MRSVWPAGDSEIVSLCPGLTADFSNDCEVNILDLVILASYWLDDVNTDCDISGDGDTNLLDAAYMADQWYNIQYVFL